MSAGKSTAGPQWAAAPRPWSFTFVRSRAAIVDVNGQPVAFVDSTRGKFEPEKANAERIVQCVNSHDELVEAAQRVMNASAKALAGTAVARWAGQENGLGEEFGKEMDAALVALRAALSKTRSTS